MITANAVRLLLWLRLGHGICLGVGLRDSDPTTCQAAATALAALADAGVGIEVNPTCNLSLGGAPDLRYVSDFLARGVDVSDHGSPSLMAAIWCLS